MSMNDRPDIIAEWGRYASSFRRLKAYAISPDGSREPLDCAAIHVELDDERGLIIALAERMDGEGVAVCSLPQGGITAAQSNTADEAQSGVQADATVKSLANQSVIVMRSGGANLVYLSPERLAGGRRS
jgi:hypothetical protein